MDRLNYISGLVVLVMAGGLMCLLGLIVVDEFRLASETNTGVDSNIVELLQMSITGVIGIVAGYVSGKGSSS
jgi:hypothetical protein